MLRSFILILAFLFGLVTLAACENNDPTGPVVSNSGSHASIAIGDDSVSATAPPPVVITPVINEPPPPVLFSNDPSIRSASPGAACVSGQGTSTRTVTC